MKLSWKKKLFLGCLTCGMFFLLLEGAFFLAGSQPLSTEQDPLAGFSGTFRLFLPDPEAPTRLTTASNRLAYFNRQSFPRDKPKSAFRIFCVGGSTTYGRPYDDETSFSGFLRAALPDIDSDRQWEVINAGGISYGSSRVVLLMKELVNYSPDLFVIYTGHNEFLEEQTYSSVVETTGFTRTLGAWAAHSRSYSAVHRLIHGDQSSPRRIDTTDSQEVKAILDRSIGPLAYHRDDVQRRLAMLQFRSNLEQMVTLAQGVGAKVCLVTPACNLRDCSPFKSEFQEGLSQSDVRRHRAHVASAEQALQNGTTDVALSEIQAALKIDNRHAATQFLYGTILLAADDPVTARRAFALAKEEDICALRALQQVIDIVRETAEQHHLPLVDFVEQIRERSDDQLPGNDWFLDHVHPTISGHEMLAHRICDVLVHESVLQTSSEQWESLFDQAADAVRQKVDPRKHGIALKNLAKVLSWAGKSDEADRLAIKAAQLLQDDAESQTLAGTAALDAGRLKEAKVHFEAALQIDPNNARAMEGMGNVFSARGEHPLAFQWFAKALRINPDSALGWFNLGNAARQMNQLATAADAYERALQMTPEHADTHKNLGLVRLTQGDITGSLKQFEAALKLDVHSSERHSDLGFVLIDAKQFDRAQQAFATAAELDPQSVSAMIGMALIHEHQGDPARARDILRRALSVAPDNRHVRDLLHRLAP